jgi:D-beta-D-heptose 7-phosphate kinase/D-beta-D-heptose 1-phosphate adenosyltransferase
LIVGINSDASVQKLKGDNRPIVNQEMRMTVVSEIKPVDYVVGFEEDTALELVKMINPDVYVKSADYELGNTPEGKYVLGYNGILKNSTFIEGMSTSAIIKKILSTKEIEQ